MLKPESNGFCSEENNRARACETCRSTPCTVYCFADSAYLCTSCDVQVHSANRVASRHKRVQVCESCEREPATFLCEADDASLCSACDSEVHSANPLARRHQRVPVLPISGNSYKSKATHQQSETTKTDQENKLVFDQESGEKADEDARDVAYWLLPNSGKISSNHSNNNQNNGLLFSDEYLDVEDYNSSMDYKKFTGQYNQQQQDCSVPQTSYGGDYWLFPNSGKISGNHSNNNQNNGLFFSDEYLDVEDYNSSMDYKKFTGQYNQQQQDCSVPQTSLGGDRVVPHQLEDASGHLRYNQQKFQSNITYGSSESHHSHNGSLHHNAHISSLETGVVPDSTALDTTASHQRTHKGMIDQLPDPPNQMITQLSPLEREARVLRYKEKRKTRKFEKTIRYASRKAYAERRPRVNGRFAKRREFEAEDQGFNTMPIYDTGHGIVPSF